jgi:hypothetical protein
MFLLSFQSISLWDSGFRAFFERNKFVVCFEDSPASHLDLSSRYQKNYGQKERNCYSLAGTERSRSAAHLITNNNSKEMYTVSRELDDTKQLLQEQQKLFSETCQVLCDLRSENEFNKFLKARSDIHLSISQNALAEAVAEKSTLKEQLTVAQSDSAFYERAHNAIWAAMCSVWSTLDPSTEDHCGCDRTARRIEDIPPQALRPTRRAEKQGSSGGAHRRCAPPCGMGSRTAHPGHLVA